MVYTKEVKLSEVVTEGGEEVLKINYEPVSYIPSIEDNPLVMMDAIDKLIENPSVSRLTFAQRRNYSYTYDQTRMLIEIANIYSYFVKSRRATSLQNLGLPTDPPELLGQRLSAIQYLMLTLLKQDPLGAYAELKRVIRKETITQKITEDQNYKNSISIYLRILNDIFVQLDKTLLINQSREYLAGFTPGDREVYKLLFRPAITPEFMLTKILASPPLDGEQLEIYKINPSTDVGIYNIKTELKNIYHLTPPEFKISEDKFELIDLAKKVLSEHEPRAEEFLDPDRMRATFTNIGKDLLRELSEQRGMLLTPEEIEEMAEILVRYTIGFGVIELLLEDERIQDVTINSPMGQVPIFVLHQDYNECVTNITPTATDFESWATKFRLISGRPLDEANPILDTEIVLPKARSRLSVIGKPLNPYGYGMAFRRHRDTPWTLGLFIKNGMISPLGAGLLSFTIDGSRSHLVAGTRSSGKTSFLGALLLEIMRRYRILTIEDSVTGDATILVRKNGKQQRVHIGSLTDMLMEKQDKWYNLTDHEVTGNPENIEVLSMDKEGKMAYSRVSKFIRHKVSKKIYAVRTASGRDLKVTGDHCLFTLSDEANISEVKIADLSKGSYIATPRRIPHAGKHKDRIRVLDYPQQLLTLYFKGGNLREFMAINKNKIKQLGKEHRHKRDSINKWFQKGILPGKILSDLHTLGISLQRITGVSCKCGRNAEWIPAEFTLDKDFLCCIGLWLADGCYDKNSVIFSIEAEERPYVGHLCKTLSLPIKYHSDDFSVMINSKTVKFVFRELLGLKGNAYTKRIPNWVMDLSRIQMSYILHGLFSGDGHVSSKEIMISLSSKDLIDDIQTLLLFYGIILRIGKFRESDKTYPARISTVRDFRIFKKQIDFIQQRKRDNLTRLCEKQSTHDTSDVIPLSKECKEKLASEIKNFRRNDYVNRNNSIGREKFGSLILQTSGVLYQKLGLLSESDIYWDKIDTIEEVEPSEKFVYDMSVPEKETFVCNNIVAHNTLELPTEAMRRLGYNIQPLKVRSALVKGGAEIPADEGIRTSLRLGDSALIVGEIRSTEASALYEAMRIGASANVVAGTIHGDSPYGVFDRVVNDLKVPRTSFKATDLIVMCNPIRTADGLRKVRRVTSITEVRKEWEEDPLAERGFVDLMKYNAKTDMLEPTPELMNGESDVLKAIGANVKEWVGNWDAIWDNIVLRGELKRLLVDYSAKTKMPTLLEAEFAMQANDMYYRVTEQIQAEVGYLDTKRIQFEWEEWLKREIRKKQMV